MTIRPMPPGTGPTAAVLLALLLVLSACAIAPPVVRETAPPTTEATAAPSVALPAPIQAEGVRAHLDALAAIAEQHGGLRTTGTRGYDASVDYVAEQLRTLGYEVETPAFEMPGFLEMPGATITIGGGDTFRAPDDFHAMIFSGGADVTARVATVGYPDSDGGEGQRACAPDDWEEFPEGAIAVTPPGRCLARTRAELAQEAGAVAVISASPPWGRGEARRPTLLRPDGIEIPVLAAIGEVGDALREAAQEDAEVEVSVHTEVETITVRNVITELPGEADTVAMLGAHLDSVHDGPGINDNGSGVAALLEIARVIAEDESAAGGAVRFGFWGGEEFGLYGSRDYVEGLAADERDAIAAYLNLDMLGSVNGVPFVYRDSAAEPGSDEISDFLVDWLETEGLGAQPQDLGGGSDHASFADAGIRTGGIFSGASERKSDEQAADFGGRADEPMDPCYHLACDTADNADADRVAAYARAAAAAALLLARGELAAGD